VQFNTFAACALGVRGLAEPSAAATLDNIVIPAAYRRNPVRFHCLVRVGALARVNLTLTIAGDGGGEWRSDGVGAGRLVRPGQFVLFTVTSDVTDQNDQPFLPSVATIRVDATWEGSGSNKNLFIRNPAVSTPAAVVDNVSARETYVRLPEYLRDADATQDSPTFPLFRFVETLLAVADEVDKKWVEFRYDPPLRGGGKPTALGDPRFADLATLYWMAQLVGVDLIDPRSGLTSWGALMEAADAAGNEDGSPSWEEWVAALDDDGPVLHDDDYDPSTPEVETSLVEWTEIQNFDIDNTNTAPLTFLNFVRWQVETAANGLRAGTSRSLEQVIEQGLGEGEPYTVERHADGDPWKIRVTVAELSIVGGRDENLRILLTPFVPAGYEIDLVVT